MSAWSWEVAERDHELQNPTSAEKIRLLGEYLRLGEGSRVLDIACGKGGPARILAATFGCRVEGIEVRSAFAQEARDRAAAEGLDSLIAVETADAATVDLEPGAYDTALCLGASFVWGTIADAAAVLRPAVRGGGCVAIGEPFWRQWPLPDATADEGWVDLAGTTQRLVDAGFALTGVIAASQDDWDRYESLHWRAIEEWLAENTDHSDAEEIRRLHESRRSGYVAFQRALLGWAIFVGRKP
ncbi:MAG: SAM-dependent methyltransferase [Gaiellaceae bacterium]